MPVVESALANFARGAFPLQEDVPDGGVGSLENALLRDDGGIERRGGVEAETVTATTGDIVQVWDGLLTAGPRTLLEDDAQRLFRVDPTDATDVELVASNALGADLIGGLGPGRARSIKGMWARAQKIRFVPPTYTEQTQVYVNFYGGAPAQGTLASGAGFSGSLASRTATVTSTTNMRVGDVVQVTATGPNRFWHSAIKSVVNATTITLADPFPFATGAYTAGVLAIQTVGVHLENGRIEGDVFLATAGGRLFVGVGRKVFQSSFEEDVNGDLRALPGTFYPEEAHDLPEGAVVLGMEESNGQVVVFTSVGVYVITNPGLRIVDDAGNVQQALINVNRHITLWGERGLASWQNTLLVPALDDLYLFVTTADAPQNEVRAVTGGARDLYRSYVKAGRKPGQAVVHQGHYVLPILNASDDPVDLIVWRADQIDRYKGAPFVGSWDGGALSDARAVTDRSPGVLLAACDKLLVDASPVFSPGTHATDAGDGFVLEVVFRPFATSETQPHTVRRARVRYESVGSGMLDGGLAWSKGAAGGTFTSIPAVVMRLEETARAWTVNKTAQMVWLQLRSDPEAPMIVRALEVAAETGRR